MKTIKIYNAGTLVSEKIDEMPDMADYWNRLHTEGWQSVLTIKAQNNAASDMLRVWRFAHFARNALEFAHDKDPEAFAEMFGGLVDIQNEED